ncbi:MAG TPA: acyloxyacyl hydrolase [Flavisolibacter sp.]
MNRCARCPLFVLLMMIAAVATAQDERAQYPGLLARSYFGVSIGYINYPFTNESMEAPYQAASIHVPHTAVKITLLGYRFNDHLSGQITYMRPVNWVEYRNINGDQSNRSVYMNVGGLTLKGNVPLGRKFRLYGEGGLGIVTRNGFTKDSLPAVKDATYATFLMGGGLDYRLNKSWELVAGMNYAPGSEKHRQPYTMFFSGGFRYNMNPLADEKVAAVQKAGYHFPKHLLQVAYTTNALGYGVNDFVSQGAIPIFWGGDAEVKSGIAVNYQRNVFHTKKVFALDIGTSAGYWISDEHEQSFWTLSVYPLFRFNVIRSRAADFYFYYSVAGPTYISRVIIDEEDTGRHFTFRDFMGIGSFIGKKKQLNAEINIGHFSNGNIFPKNGGVKVPLSFTLGLTF